MQIAVLMIIAGVVLMVWNPIWGLVPSFLLLALGVMVAIVSLLGGRSSAFVEVGSTKACPACRARIAPAAIACAQCGHQFAQS